MTLNVPDSVYQSLVRRAEQSGQPPESLAVELLASVTRRAAAGTETECACRATKQRRYLEQLSLRVDSAVLGSEEMWR